ncbi:hypothetical protein FMEAI12_3820005 [Parafrankia sp. Ea1.12]|uniref:PKD domain-containing protein n=1 Tax=Parafrankia sp. Ea1.12 TaxID=573499 RepID=UPI000DA5D463|nr:PKD domain-containing protein [Parafrankia sp. Ea1.12]SQD96909.1 hypothetical protein FMEAI12_3820005 [Parafrankia sp. Ea1.12]
MRPANLLRLTVAVALLAGGVVVLVGQAGGVPGRLLAVENGAAWLVSSATGQAALVDGASSQVVTRVAVGSGELTSTQSGPDAYIVNSTAGSVLRVDGATFEPTDPVRFGTGQRRLRVFPTSGATFVVDEESGLVTTADPGTLQARGLQSVAARAGSGGAVTDAAGRLWLIDRGSGDVVRLDDRGGKARASAGVTAGGRLVLAGGRLTVVDPTARTVRTLGDGGEPGAGACLETAPADRSVVVGGGQGRPEVYAVSGQRGTLVISDLTTGRCDTVVDLAAAGHDLGEPREVAGRLFLPDFTDGRVIVVDIGQRRVVGRPEVLPAGTRFELVVQGPFVFFNDPSSFRAGAIRLDGSTRVVEKYNPDRPGAGLTNGAGSGDNSDGGGAGDGADGARSEAAPLPDTAAAPPITRTKTAPDAVAVDDPEVTIQVSAARARIGQPVTLRLAARDGTRVAGATWSFGDGTTGSGGQTSHAWSRLGEYLVVAHATLADGRHATPAVYLTVDRTGTPPVEGSVELPPGVAPTDPVPTDLLVARLAVTPANGEAPLQISADASASTAGASPVAGYSFDFGDGVRTGGPGAAASATHTYEAADPGATFVVSVTVTDEAGNTSRASQQITITESGAPPVPTMTVTPAVDRWRVEAQAGTGAGAQTARFGLTADLADVEVTPMSDTTFDVIPPPDCAPFTVTLTAYAADGTATAASPQTLDPQTLDPQAAGLCPVDRPVLVKNPPDGFGFSIAVKDPVTDGSITYSWSYTAAGGDDGSYSAQEQANQIGFRTTDCRLFDVTVTATGPGGTATSDPVTGMGCTVPDPVVITRSVIGLQITWTWVLPSNTPVDGYYISHTYPSPQGADGDGGFTPDPGTSYTVNGEPGGTYGIGLEASNAAGSSSAQDEVALPEDGDSISPPPGDPTDDPPPDPVPGDDPTTPPPDPVPGDDPTTPPPDPIIPDPTTPPPGGDRPEPEPEPESTPPPPQPAPTTEPPPPQTDPPPAAAATG